MSKFLIIGLPRSRTAWLSVFFSTGKSFCHHEPMVTALPEIAALYENPMYEHVGISDASALVPHLEHILEVVKPRTLIVDRDPDECFQALIRAGLPMALPREYFYNCHKKLLQFHKHPLAKTVPFRSLDRMMTMMSVFSHLLPGEPFDEQRHNELQNLKIEQHFAKRMQNALHTIAA